MRRCSGWLAVAALLFIGPAAALFPALAASKAASPVTPETLMSRLKWRSVGPYIGGRVIAVTGVPGNPNLFYAGAVGGGIWKSTDEGVRWVNISDGKLAGPSSSIGAIAVAPSQPETLYAGTGEDDIRNDMIPGDGIYKSTDGGNTWQLAGLGETHSISAIIVSPKDSNVVYASSMGHVFVPGPNRGVFKTTDGGKTWKKILFVDDKTGAIDLVMDPNHPKVLYAATWQAQRMPWGLISGGPGSGIYKTTDGGKSWKNITRSPGLPQGVLGRIGLSIAASKPNVVYAICQAKDGGIFRSDDAGAKWKRVNDEMKLRQRAFYYMAIYADPKDPNTVYVPEVDALWVSHDGAKSFQKLHTPHGDNHIIWINPNDTRILLEGNDGGATVSTDDGNTWSTEDNQPTGQFYHVNLDDQFPYHIYGAQQDEGSYEGPSASSDGRIPLSAWHSVADGESTFTVPQPGDPNITYGSGYYTIFRKYNLHTGQYQGISPWPLYQAGASSAELKDRFGWTHPILFSPVNPNELLIAAQYVFKSDDHGATWTRISPDLTRNLPSTEIASGGPVDLDESGAEVYPEVSSLAVSPLDGDLLWAGSDDGLVHVTTDGGKNWRDVTPPGLPKCEISSIEPSHADKRTAYLTAWRYMWDDFRPFVFRTTDMGQHWTAITSGLPQDEFTFAIRQDPRDPNLLLLGTYSTVYVSLDGGSNWRPLTLNLPKAEVRDIAVNPRQGNVVVATHGRSFWVLDNLTLLEQLTKKPSVMTDSSYLFAPEKTWLTHVYGSHESEDSPHLNAGKNPPFGATVFFHIPQNYDGKTPANLEFLDAQGTVIRSFPLHLETAKEKKEKAEEEAAEKGEQKLGAKGKPRPDHSQESAARQLREAEAKLTAIEPGMNHFQWDLRYPPEVEVTGYHPPDEPGSLASGPAIVPGTYSVVLDYGGQKMKQSFAVALDPRLQATQQDLDARLALAQQIKADLNTLDTDANHALAVQAKLQKAASGHGLDAKQAADALTTLDGDFAHVVQMNIRSSEGDLLHQVKLYGYLSFLGNDIDQAYARPTAAQYAVFHLLHKQATQYEQKLEADIANANRGKAAVPAKNAGAASSE